MPADDVATGPTTVAGNSTDEGKGQTMTQTETTDLVPLEQEVGPRLVKLMAEAPHVTTASSGDVLDIVARLLDAPDPEAMNRVFSGEGGTNSRDLARAGTDVKLRSATVSPSDYPDPETGQRGWYVRYDAVNLDTGEELRISSSSKTVFAAFVRADSLGIDEITGRFVYGKTTDEGFTPVNFEFDTADSKRASAKARGRRK